MYDDDNNNVAIHVQVDVGESLHLLGDYELNQSVSLLRLIGAHDNFIVDYVLTPPYQRVQVCSILDQPLFVLDTFLLLVS